MSDVKGRAREALTGITPGPWEVADEIDGVRAGRPTVVKATHSDGYFAGRKSRVVTVDQTRRHFGDGRTERGQDEANVAFIAAAPSLVADLLSLVEEQEAQIAALEKRLDPLKVERTAARLRYENFERKGVAIQVSWGRLTEAQKVPWILAAEAHLKESE